MTFFEHAVVSAVGRILDLPDPRQHDRRASIGTCFQIAPGLLITARHVIGHLIDSDPPAVIAVEQLRDPTAGTFEATVIGTDADHDLALLKCNLVFPASLDLWASKIQTSTEVTAVGAPDVKYDRRVETLTVAATWAGDMTRDGGRLFGHVQCKQVFPGMSGGPVTRSSDGALVGVVIERYMSPDAGRDTAWLALPADIARLVDQASLDVRVAQVGNVWTVRRRIDPRCADLLIFDGPVPLNVLVPWFAGHHDMDRAKVHDAIDILIAERFAETTPDGSAVHLTDPYRKWADTIADDDSRQAAHVSLAEHLRTTYVEDCLDACNQAETRRALSDAEIYTLDHLARHMERGRQPHMVDLVLRRAWITARIRVSVGSSGIEADLARSTDDRAVQFGRIISRASHLLGTMDLPANVAPDWALESTIDGRFLAESRFRPETWGNGPQSVGLFNPKGTGLAFDVPPRDAAPELLRRVLDLPHGSPTCAAISTDGTALVVGADNGTIRSWNVADWTLRFERQVEPSAPISCCAANVDASLVVAGCADGWLHVVRDGHAPESHHVHRESITGCLVHPEAEWIITTALDGHTSQWDRQIHRETALQVRELLSSYAMPPDASWVAGSTRDGTIRIWNPNTKKAIASWSADNRGVVLSTRGLDRIHLLTLGATTQMWELTSESDLDAGEVVTFVERESHETGWASTCAMSPDGEWIVAGRPDGTLTVLAAKGERIRIVEQPHDVINSCVASPVEPWFVTTGDECDIAVWDFPVPPITSRIHLEDPEIISCAPTTEPGISVAGGPDGAVMLFDSSADVVSEEHPGVHRWPVRLCTIDPRDSTIITGDESGVFFRWYLAPPDSSGFRLRHSRIDGSPVVPPGTNAMAYLPRSGSVLTGSGGLVTLHHPLPGGTFDSRKPGDHTVTALAVSPSEQLAVAGDIDGRIHFIDLVRRETPASLQAHTGEVTASAVAADGTILTAGSDRVLRLWRSERWGDLPTCRAAVRTAHIVEHCYWKPGTRAILLAAGRGGLYSMTYTPAVLSRKESEQS